MYYLFLFLILSIIAAIDVIIENRNLQLFFLGVVYFLLFFTSGLKYETGVDWRAYTELVESIEPLNRLNTAAGYSSVFDGIDVGFNLLISVLKFFGGGIQTLFFVLSAFSTVLLVVSVRRYLKYSVLGIVLYYGLIFFYLDMSGIRQATSLSIIFYGLKYIKQKQAIKYSLCLFSAFTFHWSSIFLFPLYWITRMEFNKWIVFGVTFIAAIFYFLGIKWLSSLMPGLFGLFQYTNFANKIFTYSTNESFTPTSRFDARTLIHIFFLLSTLILSIRYKDKLTSLNTYYPIFHSILVIQVLVFFTFYELPELAERVKLYFYISNIVILPSFVLIFRQTLIKGFWVTFIILYSLFYSNAHIFQKPFTIAYYPYQNYFIYKIFGFESTGQRRLNQHAANSESQ